MGSCYGATSHNNVTQCFHFGTMQFTTICLECDCVQVGQRCVNVAIHKNWPGLSVAKSRHFKCCAPTQPDFPLKQKSKSICISGLYFAQTARCFVKTHITTIIPV